MISLSKNAKRVLFIFLSSTLVLFFLLTRLYNFPNRFTFDADQEQAAQAAWKIIIEHKLVLVGLETSRGGLFVGPLIYWMNAIALWISGMNPIGIGYEGIFISLLTILTLFFVTANIFNKWQGLIVVFLYVISERITNYDLLGSPITYIMLISTLIFWLTYKVFCENRANFLPFLLFALALSFQVHYALVLFFPVEILLFIWYKPKLKISHIFYSSVAFFIPLITFIFFELRHKLIISTHLLNFSRTSAGHIKFEKIFEIIYTLTAIGGETVLIYPKYHVIIFLCFIIAVVLFLIKSKRKKLLSIILLFIFTPPILLGFYSDVIPEYYFLPIVPVLLIIASLIYYKIFKFNQIIFVVLIMSISIYNLVKFKDNQSTAIPFSLKVKTVNDIIKEAGNDEFNVYFQMPPGINTGYAYLFKWKKREPKDFSKKLFIIEFIDPKKFNAFQYYNNYPGRQIKMKIEGSYIHLISII